MTDSRKRMWSRAVLVLCVMSAVFMLLMVMLPAKAAQLQTEPPLSNPGQLFTSEIILSLVFLLTVPLTTLVGALFKLEGATASIVANVILNFFAKGVTLVVTNQATPVFAAVAFVIGVVLDKTIYDLLTKPKTEKIAALEAENTILARGYTVPNSGG